MSSVAGCCAPNARRRPASCVPAFFEVEPGEVRRRPQRVRFFRPQRLPAHLQRALELLVGLRIEAEALVRISDGAPDGGLHFGFAFELSVDLEGKTLTY